MSMELKFNDPKVNAAYILSDEIFHAHRALRLGRFILNELSDSLIPQEDLGCASADKMRSALREIDWRVDILTDYVHEATLQISALEDLYGKALESKPLISDKDLLAKIMSAAHEDGTISSKQLAGVLRELDATDADGGK